MIDMVIDAYDLARAAHEGQLRELGDDKDLPYFIHPERVGNSFELADYKVVGYLHDVIEDTDITAEDLLKKFPAYIVEAVVSVTKVAGEGYLSLILRAKANTIGREVKLADIRDNLKSLHKGNMRDKYILAEYILEKAI